MFRRVGLEYTEDYCKKQEWYLTKSWTVGEQNDFKEWGKKLLKKELKMSNHGSEKEMGWFLLSCGWGTEE